MSSKILSELIDPEVLWKVKKTLSPSISAFTNYFLTSEDMGALKLKFISLCKNSDLENEQIRPMAWKIFFKVLPCDENSNLKSWIIKTISDRQKYENIIKKENINSIKFKGDPLTNFYLEKKSSQNNHNNETNNHHTNNNNNWDKFFNGYDLKKTIEQDINRTFQNLKLFQDNCVRELLLDILFYWSVQPENKKMSYRQGMNDLLSILFFAFFPFYFSEKKKVKKNKKNENNNINNANNINKNNNELYSKEEQEFLSSLCKEPSKNSKTLYLFFHDEKYISHDLFTIFCNMMTLGIKKLYENPNDMINNSNVVQEEFLNFKVEGEQIDIVYKRALDIYHNKLRNYDQELFSNLIKHNIDPTTFMIRWLRCLFCREFTYKVSIQLWDIIFLEEYFQSDNKFQFVDYLCVAMYENIRDDLLNGHEEDILGILFKYPQIDTPKNLIKNAYKIRSFFDYNSYQNQSNKEDFNKEAKININKNNNINNINNFNHKNENKMSKKEKEIYDFEKKDINPYQPQYQHPKEERYSNNNISIYSNNNINTDFKMCYMQIPNDKEGEMLKSMTLISKLKNLEKKYGRNIQKEDDEDFKFVIKELYSKLKFK